jgi:hypothetical protein
MADFISGVIGQLGRPTVSANQFDGLGKIGADVIDQNQQQGQDQEAQYIGAMLNATPEQRQMILAQGTEAGVFDEDDSDLASNFDQYAPQMVSFLQVNGYEKLLPEAYRNDAKKLSVKGVEGDMLFTDGKGNYFSNQTFLDPNTQTTNSVLTDISGGGVTPQGDLMPVNKMGQTIQQKREDDKNTADDEYDSQKKFKGAIAKAVELGKLQAADEDSLETKIANMPLINEVVADLRKLAPIATSTFGGNVWNAVVKETGFGATKGKTAKTKYQSIISNQTLPLLKATFGAAFTAAEGQKLEATLGDPDASTDEKLAALDAFLDAQNSQIQALERKLGQEPSPPAAQPAAGTNITTQAQYDALPSGAIYIEDGKRYQKP